MKLLKLIKVVHAVDNTRRALRARSAVTPESRKLHYCFHPQDALLEGLGIVAEAINTATSKGKS